MRKFVLSTVVAVALGGPVRGQFHDTRTGRDMFGLTPGDRAAAQQAYHMKRHNDLLEREPGHGWRTAFLVSLGLNVALALVLLTRRSGTPAAGQPGKATGAAEL